ncbi:hypothetical protein A2U01_0003902, partial [Trifolium medium]|nr:hypothetical protein [Trifolium medium]
QTMVTNGAPMAQEAESWGLLGAIKWHADLGSKRVSIELDLHLDPY